MMFLTSPELVLTSPELFLTSRKNFLTSPELVLTSLELVLTSHLWVPATKNRFYPLCQSEGEKIASILENTRREKVRKMLYTLRTIGRSPVVILMKLSFVPKKVSSVPKKVNYLPNKASSVPKKLISVPNKVSSIPK